MNRFVLILPLAGEPDVGDFPVPYQTDLSRDEMVGWLSDWFAGLGQPGPYGYGPDPPKTALPGSPVEVTAGEVSVSDRGDGRRVFCPPDIYTLDEWFEKESFRAV